MGVTIRTESVQIFTLGRLALLLVLLLAGVSDAVADEPSFADARKAVRKSFKRLDLERPKTLEKQLRPRLPQGIVTESAPFDALVEGLLRPHETQLEARVGSLEALAAFPASRAGAAIEASLRALDKEAAELEDRIVDVEAAYAEVFNRGYMASSEGVRGTRKLAAVLIPYYRRLLLANRAAAMAAAHPLTAWARGDGFSWVATRATATGGARLRRACARALGAVPTDAAKTLLRELRSSDPDVAVRIEALQALLAAPPESARDDIVAALEDEAWQVRAIAIAACRRATLLSAVGPLIEALGRETGRLVTDIDDALYAIVGVRMYGDAVLWQAWWEENEADLRAREGTPADEEEPERRGGTASFYGIVTTSQRVLFVVDISFSMDHTATAGGKSKLHIAKEQLASALADLPDEALVDIIVYSESYAAWQGSVVTLGKQRKKAAAFIASLRANGTTNIADAVDKAFGMDVDTVFLLSDGDPNRGRITDLSALLRELLERNEEARFVFHTIGIGDAAGSSFLKALASQTGGRYVEAR